VKNRYRKVWGGRVSHPGEFYYDSVDGRYGRAISTFPEIRRNTADLNDRELRELGLKVRRCRAGQHLNSWNLERSQSRFGKRTWKDFTRHRRQWEVGRDPKPVWDDLEIRWAITWGEPLPW
jgi:hypothetical protein